MWRSESCYPKTQLIQHCQTTLQKRGTPPMYKVGCIEILLANIKTSWGLHHLTQSFPYCRVQSLNYMLNMYSSKLWNCRSYVHSSILEVLQVTNIDNY